MLEALDPGEGSRVIDGTVGAGGHAKGILDRGSALLGLDRDSVVLPLAQQRLKRYGDRLHLRQGSYADMASYAAEIGWTSVDGILLDLGLSSIQLDDPARGFSFRADGPLDMRFDPAQELTAADLVNTLSERELADLLFEYGEERRSRQIAHAIVEARPLRGTLELSGLIERAGGGRRGRIHPATRSFQALRIAVNDELATLETALPSAAELLAPEGRLVVIAFHSLEDRIVKRFFRDREDLERLTRKPIRPDDAEIESNPRARSARMRVAEKT